METEGNLSNVLSEFARTMLTDFPIQAILDHLVVRIVDVLPITAAGVSLVSPGVEPREIAASDDSALGFEQLQTELGEGPCVTAFQTGEAVSVTDLRNDSRYPRFAPQAVERGMEAVFAFPLRQGDHQLGALDLYRTTSGALDAATEEAAQTLADVATAYLLNAQARAELRQIALRDPLTGLPNRTLLIERLDQAIQRCQQSERMVAVLFADLDRFKSVNDAYGHHVGDQLLTGVAERLTGLLRPGDTLARLAGDEFAILCEEIEERSQGELLAEQFGAALSEPFDLAGAKIEISASVGVGFGGRGDDLAEDVLQDADTAMYQAKRKGGARHAVIDLGEQRVTNDRASLSRDLSSASAQGQLRTVYQPIVATADGRITGVEALLRWEHPSQGLLDPQTAVPLAEQSGLIIEIGYWVLEQACLDRQRWERHDHHELEISVNVSASQLMVEDFVTMVGSVLTRTRTDPKLLTLEVTESVFLEESDRALVVLNDLKGLGVKLALDDFGTGYSSLSYLNQFPVDIVKIDRVFIADLSRNPTSSLIVSAVVGLAHGLGMTVTAEGVEDPTQHEEIAALGCDSYQGYYFARPTSADHLDTLLGDGGGYGNIRVRPSAAHTRAQGLTLHSTGD